MFFKMVSVIFRSIGHLSVSTLLTEFMTKKMSGGEKKQGVRRRSVEGQCTKHSRKLEPREKQLLLFICELEGAGWRYGGGTGISDRRVGSAAPVENLSYSLICEKRCATVGNAPNNGVITGI